MSPQNLTKREKIKLLEEFIQGVSGSKELKRGLAVKLTLEGYTYNANKRPRRKQRGIVTLFLTFHTPQGAGNLPVILLKKF